MSRPTHITIDLNALRNNASVIKKTLAPYSRHLWMVKSNGYGHGIERIAASLPEADAFGVACMEEAMQLRDAGIHQPIVLMEGLFSPSECKKAVSQRLSLVIHHAEQVAMLERSRITPSESISIWLKINTGMNRLGVSPEEFRSVYRRLNALSGIHQPIHLMTHFGMADAIDPHPTEAQIEVFNRVTEDLPNPQSLCNSAGILAWSSAHRDWVRPGLILYGISPIIGYTFQPVMTLSSQLIAIQSIRKGQWVGYGGDWICPEDMNIGIVPVGYGDGYPQHAHSNTPILVNNTRCSLAGRVSMDMLAIDLRGCPQAAVGDPVELWGKNLSVSDVAIGNHTSAYELLTRITQRVRVTVHPIRHPVDVTDVTDAIHSAVKAVAVEKGIRETADKAK